MQNFNSDGIGKNFENILLECFLDKRLVYTPISDYSYLIEGYLFFDHGGTYRRGAILDVDNTLTKGNTLYWNWLTSLTKYNSQIDKNFKKLEDCIKRFDNNPTNLRIYDEFISLLNKYGLTYGQHREASLDAAERTSPVNRTKEFLSDLEHRNITSALISASPVEPLIFWSIDKLGIPKANIIATQLKFGPNGIFDKCVTIGEGKIRPAENFIEKINCKRELVCVIDDDPVADRVFALMLGSSLVIWVDRDRERRELEAKGLYKYPGRIYVVKEASSNLQELTPIVDRAQRAVVTSKLMNAREIVEIAREAKNMKSIVEKCKNCEKETIENASLFADSYRRISNYPLISTVLSGIDKQFTEFLAAFYKREVKAIKKCVEEIYDSLYSQNPEFQLLDDQLEKISEFI